jgi:hypothetical protein
MHKRLPESQVDTYRKMVLFTDRWSFYCGADDEPGQWAMTRSPALAWSAVIRVRMT